MLGKHVCTALMYVCGMANVTRNGGLKQVPQFAMCGGPAFQTSRGVFVVESVNDS